MSADNPIDIEVKTGVPHTFGWMRRAELDQHGAEVWEKPDGELYLWNKRRGVMVLHRCLPKRRK